MYIRINVRFKFKKKKAQNFVVVLDFLFYQAYLKLSKIKFFSNEY